MPAPQRRPTRRIAVARLRRLARYLARLPRAEYDQEHGDRCVIGHGRRLFRVPRAMPVFQFLGIPRASISPILGPFARVRTPTGKAKQLLALAARLAKGR